MKYFKFSEFLKSGTAIRQGIPNRPSAKVLDNLQELTEKVLDPLREKWGSPLKVTSGYRCRRLNAAVGGSPTSQHMTGEAADITALDKRENLALWELLVMLKDKLPVDQVIWEKGTSFPMWIHVSHRCGALNGKQRRQFFRL